jgi:hypothetical protein
MAPRPAECTWLRALVPALAAATCVARAGGDASLFLPLATAVAVGAPEESPERERTPPTFPPSSRLVGLAPAPAADDLSPLLPSQLRIPDGYAVDVRPGLATVVGAPIESQQFLSLDLLRQRRQGWMASVIYDEEDGRPFRGSSGLVRVAAELRF